MGLAGNANNYETTYNTTSSKYEYTVKSGTLDTALEIPANLGTGDKKANGVTAVNWKARRCSQVEI